MTQISSFDTYPTPRGTAPPGSAIIRSRLALTLFPPLVITEKRALRSRSLRLPRTADDEGQEPGTPCLSQHACLELIRQRSRVRTRVYRPPRVIYLPPFISG